MGVGFNFPLHCRNRKFLQIQVGRLAEIVEGLGHGLALGAGAGLGVQGDKAAFFGRNQDGGKRHGNNLRDSEPESTLAVVLEQLMNGVTPALTLTLSPEERGQLSHLKSFRGRSELATG
jgi:hypothetical protein